MSELISFAEQHLLVPSNLSITKALAAFDVLHSHRIDFADLYFQSTVEESWILEESIVKSGSYHASRGVGVRALSGEKTGFAYSDVIENGTLLEAAKAARGISSAGQSQRILLSKDLLSVPCYAYQDPLYCVSTEEKIAFLHQIDRVSRKLDSQIKEVTACLSSTYEIVLVLNSAGHIAADVRPLLRCDVSVIAENAQGRRESGNAGGGGRYDYSQLIREDLGTKFAKEAVRQAMVNLQSQPAPAGVMPVVLGPGWPAVLLHEAVGHGLEGDFNRKGSSVYAGRLGERVASPLCTIVDEGCIAHRRGSLSLDDEGHPTQRTMLIESGILKGYLHDSLSARLMDKEATGNARRESYAHVPLPRMTNTYMLPGQDSPSDIIQSVDKGIYAVNFSGGQVDITSGQFVFTTSEAYMIEQGRITHPLKAVTLIGNGAEVLQKISMVGDDLKLDEGVGVCGKEGQGVPVGVGQPTLKIESITVGGTV